MIDESLYNVVRVGVPTNGRQTLIIIEPITPAAPTGYGIDVSRWQVFDAGQWKRLIDEGKPDFAFIKASQGNYTDPLFEQHWTNSAAIKRRGVYHYLSADYSAEIQAAALRNAISGKAVEWVAVDIEDSAITAKLVTDFLALVAEGNPLVIYTRASIWNGLGLTSSLPLWVASYRVDAPILPNGWKEWTFWQPGQTILPGSLKADVNVCGIKPAWWSVSRLPEEQTGPTMGKCGPAKAGTIDFYDKPNGVLMQSRPTTAADVFDQWGCAFTGWVCVYAKPGRELWCKASDLMPK